MKINKFNIPISSNVAKLKNLLINTTRKSVLTSRKFRLALKFADSKIIFCVWSIKKRKNPLSSLAQNAAQNSFFLFLFNNSCSAASSFSFNYSTNYFIFFAHVFLYAFIPIIKREFFVLSAWEQLRERERFSRIINGILMDFFKHKLF